MTERAATPKIGVVVKVVVRIVLFSLILASCGIGQASRSSVLADLANEVIIPAYNRFQDSAEELQKTVVKLCENLAENNLIATRNALSVSFSRWSYIEYMTFGAVTERRSRTAIRWPIDDDQIEGLIADNTIALTQNHLKNSIGADQRGLHAIEYILYTAPLPATADSTVDGSSTTVDGSSTTEDTTVGSSSNIAVLESLLSERRCEYLQGITKVVADEATHVATAWSKNTLGVSHFDNFTNASNDSLDTVINDILLLLKEVTDKQLGAALGVANTTAGVKADVTSTRKQPNLIPEGPSADGVEEITAKLNGIADVMIGYSVSGSGLAPLLGGQLTSRLKSEINDVGKLLNAIEIPLRSLSVKAPRTVLQLHNALKTIQNTVATDVVSRLDVLLEIG